MWLLNSEIAGLKKIPLWVEKHKITFCRFQLNIVQVKVTVMPYPCPIYRLVSDRQVKQSKNKKWRGAMV